MTYPIIGTSIFQSWVFDLSIRHQGVLIAAVRGCDGQPKNNSAKPITRAIRGAFLHPADEREMEFPNAFMRKDFTIKELYIFLGDWDHYPVHFVQHIMHGLQVIGYKHPNEQFRSNFLFAYYAMVDKLHLKPEPVNEMDERLTKDRIITRDGRTVLTT